MADDLHPTSQENSATEISTLLGKGSEFAGKLTFEGTVRIDGKFSGEIFSEGTLVVGAGAELEADINVRSVLIQGSVIGNVAAVECVEIHAPGRVHGTLKCPQLLIQKGVVFDGTCQMSETSSKAEPKASGGEASET